MSEVRIPEPEPIRLALDTEQAATAIGISRAEIYRLISAGELRSVKIGRRRLITVSALQEFLASLETARERGASA